jgi:hypothetical protein
VSQGGVCNRTKKWVGVKMSITTMSPNKVEREVSRVIDRAGEVGGHNGAGGGWEFLEGGGRSIEGSKEVSEVKIIVCAG